MRWIGLVFAAALLLSAGCNKKEGGDAAKGEAEGKTESSLALSNDTAACQGALKCCEAMLETTTGKKPTGEEINLGCSGVGMAPDDNTCGEFKKGYVSAIEAAGKEVPAACK